MAQENKTALENFIPPIHSPFPSSPFLPSSTPFSFFPSLSPLPPPPPPLSLSFSSFSPPHSFRPFSFPPPLTLTHRFIGRLCSIPGKFLQQEHEQLPPLLHAGVEKCLVANLTLVAKTLNKERKRLGVSTYAQTQSELDEPFSSLCASQKLGKTL